MSVIVEKVVNMAIVAASASVVETSAVFFAIVSVSPKAPLGAKVWLMLACSVVAALFATWAGMAAEAGELDLVMPAITVVGAAAVVTTVAAMMALAPVTKIASQALVAVAVAGAVVAGPVGLSIVGAELMTAAVRRARRR